jgi:hypothetical protein
VLDHRHAHLERRRLELAVEHHPPELGRAPMGLAVGHRRDRTAGSSAQVRPVAGVVVLDEADVLELIAITQRAARLLFDDAAARWALGLAAMAAAGQPRSTPEPAPAIVALDEWCAITGTSPRTARRHAAAGKVPGASKRGARWVVATRAER